jgi:bifunctional DNA-binding transcriptional regulator/antitoxin component of YhaV-PrlF toxin-antitoxin module
MQKEVGRTVDLEMDHRGRIIIPKQLRDRYEIEPAEGETTWLTVTVDEAEVSDGGNQ